MGTLIVTEFLTLDGVMEAPHEWSFPYWNDEIAKFKLEEVFATDALLLGCVTYEGFAAAWPSRTDDAGFADRFNNMPKYVVSKTLTKAGWNNSHLIQANVAGEIAKLKAQTEQDIAIHGSGQLIQSLLREGLIDRYQLLVYPLVLGRGRRLFPEGSEAKLELVEAKPLGSVVLLTYQPAAAEKRESEA